ncbi:MAG: glucan biosynthesis protein, partial [Pseudomonadota bacterium]
MLRRDVLKSLAALAAVPAAGFAEEPGLQLGDAQPFDATTVKARAKALAQADYVPRPLIPESWRNLTYDQYRKIWFDGRNALWEGSLKPQ